MQERARHGLQARFIVPRQCPREPRRGKATIILRRLRRVKAKIQGKVRVDEKQRAVSLKGSSAFFDGAEERSEAMFDTLKRDLDAVLARDPAVHSRAEVFFCYPGFRAVRRHRRAHRAYERGHFFWARLISARTKRLTGIDIHPGAVIGEGLFIDHGAGVVIGETAVLGRDVTLYQGVTLGGTGKDTGKRHPNIGNGVTIGAGAKVLGPITIGDNSKVGAGSVVLKDVPPNCTVVGNPGRVVRKKTPAVQGEVDLDQVNLPDPMLEKMQRLYERLTEMEKCLAKHAVESGCAGCQACFVKEDLERAMQEIKDETL